MKHLPRLVQSAYKKWNFIIPKESDIDNTDGVVVQLWLNDEIRPVLNEKETPQPSKAFLQQYGDAK